MDEELQKYADIIDLPYPGKNHKERISMAERGAQFSPFAALTGFDDVIDETGRRTDLKRNLSDGEKEQLNRKMTLLDDRIRMGEYPAVQVSYFVSDPRKEGGAYFTLTGCVREVDSADGKLIFLAENGISAGIGVPMADILDIRGEIFTEME